MLKKGNYFFPPQSKNTWNLKKFGETTFPTLVQISEINHFSPIKTFQDLFENLADYRCLTYD